MDFKGSPNLGPALKSDPESFELLLNELLPFGGLAGEPSFHLSV